MPNIKSKAQLGLMQAILHGDKPRGGKKISKATAKEVIGNPAPGQYKNLPEKVGKKK
jgi:hypothetical protein